MDYKGYLKSDEWVKRRKKFYSNHSRVCRACGKRYYLNLHHLTYKNLGHEKDEDFAVLCQYCHHYIHANKTELAKFNDYIYKRNKVKNKSKGKRWLK